MRENRETIMILSNIVTMVDERFEVAWTKHPPCPTPPIVSRQIGGASPTRLRHGMASE